MFNIAGTTATANGVTSGSGTLKGCACTDASPTTKGQCQPFQQNVTVK
jgi:hypothetical protein